MRRMVSVGFGVLVCLMLLPSAGAAQGTGDASIAGTVKDASGAVLPGVTIEASSPALIEKVRSTLTDEKGEYRIIQLRPGPYAVTFTLAGFSTFKREGLELGPNFVATVNVELKVGGLEETVTVSGETPLVDTTSVAQQTSITKAMLDTVPTGKGIYGFVAMMPSAVTPAQFQDVGGSLADSTTRISIHGASPRDQRLLMDGLSYNLFNDNGTARGFFVNPLAAQEVVIETGAGGSAEFALGGAAVNMISKDGGNVFSGTLFATGSNDSLQSNNLTDDLKAQGLSSVNKSLEIYDMNAVVGGPIVRDTLWFVSAHRRHGQQHRVANLYYDANFNARAFGAPASVWKFAPDPSGPVEPSEDNQAHNIRLIWQAKATHKVTFSYDWQWNRNQDNINTLSTGTLAWEANGQGGNYRCTQQNQFQATWTHPATSKLLFEAGANYIASRLSGPKCQVADLSVQIRESSTNFLYGGNGTTSLSYQYPTNQRVSMSYVTGAHNFKAGVSAQESAKPTTGYGYRGAIPFSYTFNNGLPTQLTEFVSPVDPDAATSTVAQKMALGIFAQDQWKISRLTINLGLRYDYLNDYAPAFTRTVSTLADAASFPEVNCLPCWHDINPRAAVAYDLFGDGKTAVKASIGKYSGGIGTTFAEAFRPITSAVNSTTRAWTDSNGNFYPDCDLRNPAINGECQAMANQSFGQIQIRTSPDPDWITGWGKRGYNWQASASVDRELRPGVAVNAGYYRNWIGNFTATDNLLVTPDDYEPYCITAPTDARLPSNISGQQLCGYYDLKTTKFGQINNLVTLASHYGNQTEVYNGVDVGLTARLPHGAQVSGGWNVGNSVSLPSGTGVLSNKANRCFVVDSPQELLHPPNATNTAAQNGCESVQPYQHRIKLNGSFPLPLGLQAAFVYQSLPGAPYAALYTVTTAQILPSLGRNLAGGTRTVTIDLLPPYSAYVDQRTNQVDLRLSKIVRINKIRFQGNFDLYNMLNSSTVVAVNQAYTAATWLQPTQLIPGRLFKFGVQMDF